MLEMMRAVLAWLRFLAWSVWYALAIGTLVVVAGGGFILWTALWAVSYWLWGVYWPGVVGMVVIALGLLGAVAAYDEGKAPK